MSNIKRIDIKEFREKGFLQEVNRQFFHPLGIALEVTIENDGRERLSGIWDYREDPEGIRFQEGMIEKTKTEHINQLRESKRKEREKLFGDIIQSS